MQGDTIDRTIIAAVAQLNDDRKILDVVHLGQAAYERLVSRFYPCPGVRHPQDYDDKLSDLILRIVTLDPSIIELNITHTVPHARFRVLSAAILSGRKEFTNLIIGRLRDRSIYVLDSAVRAIEQHPGYRTERACELLKEFLRKKNSRRLSVPVQRIENIIREIERNQAGQACGANAMTPATQE